MTSAPPKPLKGILKKPHAAALISSTPAAAPTNPRDPRTVALHRARLLQTRKDTEAEIFANTLSLLDLPLHPSHPASSPHPADADAFARLVRVFQPSDYDDMIIERNLDTTSAVNSSDGGSAGGGKSPGRCGYALCPNARRRFRGAGMYKMVNKGRKSFDIVETAELEKWCSTECTRRALWVKVQLHETAAWERVGLPELKIELYPEKEETKMKKVKGNSVRNQESIGDDAEKLAADVARLQLEEGHDKGDDESQDKSQDEKLAADMATLQLEHDRKAAQDKAALAIERGDEAKDTSTRAVDVIVREKKVTTQAQAPSAMQESAEANTIEGYKSKFGGDKKAANEDSDDDWF